MTKALWTWGSILGLTGGTEDGMPARPMTGVSIDTRSLEPGDIFVALTAERDGHAFVTSAFKAGAACAIVADTYARQAGDGALLRVADPLAAMADLGRVARFRGGARVIAVTGSVGKTSTKEALRAALARIGPVHASEKSYNNHWGVPLTLARLSDEARHAVLEIGMNHPGEIAPLSRMAAPDIAIITTVEAVHLGHFASVEAIADAKAEIFDGLEPDGIAILNRDNAYYERLSNRATETGARIVTFGQHAKAHVRLVECKLGPAGSDVTAERDGRRIAYRLGAPGRHLVQNSLAIVAAIDALGAPLDATLAALADLGQPAGRGARVPLAQGRVLIDESYNASPASVRAALATMATTPREQHARRIAVLGDMRELGDRGPDLHRELAKAVADAGIDKLYGCGPLMKTLFDAVPRDRRGEWAESSKDLVAPLLAGLAPGDLVMVKGSLGTNMAPIVTALKARA